MRYFQALHHRLHAWTARRARDSVTHINDDRDDSVTTTVSADLPMDWLEPHHSKEWPVRVIAALQILVCVLLAGALTTMEVLPKDAQAQNDCTNSLSVAPEGRHRTRLACCRSPALSTNGSTISCPTPSRGA